ncbi:MAG: hypothetical protein IT359_13155 [Gemmatimonadaceae bacterium]|nr:hypothetical protein [Gemmatimonadaceae bacterium]
MAIGVRIRVRPALLAGVAALALGAGGWGYARFQARHHRPRVAREFTLGARWADSVERLLAVQSPAEMKTGDVTAALYLERLRLGIGSPFRLVEYASRDPFLSVEGRDRLAEAILARTSVGSAYVTPQEALDLVAPRPSPNTGRAHRQFMESVTEAAASPRAAELALRLAYTVGTASGVVSHRASAVALGAIAQARDRALAMRDVAALLREARRVEIDPVELVSTWRAQRRFAVEKPLADPPSPADEEAAVRLLPRLVAQLSSLEAMPLASATSRSLGGAAGAAAAEVVARRHAPPQAPVTVTMGGYGSFVSGALGTAESQRARAQFVARTRNEESMAAELARLRAVAGPSSEAALAVLSASVAMRAYAQERPWFPGDAGPDALAVRNRLGLASLEFDRDVPASWRPYYTRMLDDVVSDLTTVFPALDLRGLNVRFGDSPLADRALALHDPGTRTAYFPLATSAGAMAHELAHDLDWQAARRAYGVRGGYRTDRSVRQYADRFSLTARKLASAARPRREMLSSSVQADRPTEAFARGVDWFVAASLAHLGRVNGYLSSVQDGVITGYASAAPPRGGTVDGDVTLDALREMTLVAPRIFSWYDETYGSAREARVSDIVRRTLVAPLSRVDLRYGTAGGGDAFSGTLTALRASTDVAAGWRCLLEPFSRDVREEGTVPSAMAIAAEARSRGLVQRWGEYASAHPAASARVRALGGGPWQPAIRDSVMREVRDAILWRAARPDDGRAGIELSERAERRAAWDRCAAGR